MSNTDEQIDWWEGLDAYTQTPKKKKRKGKSWHKWYKNWHGKQRQIKY